MAESPALGAFQSKAWYLPTTLALLSLIEGNLSRLLNVMVCHRGGTNSTRGWETRYVGHDERAEVEEEMMCVR